MKLWRNFKKQCNVDWQSRPASVVFENSVNTLEARRSFENNVLLLQLFCGFVVLIPKDQKNKTASSLGFIFSPQTRNGPCRGRQRHHSPTNISLAPLSKLIKSHTIAKIHALLEFSLKNRIIVMASSSFQIAARNVMLSKEWKQTRAMILYLHTYQFSCTVVEKRPNRSRFLAY